MTPPDPPPLLATIAADASARGTPHPDSACVDRDAGRGDPGASDSCDVGRLRHDDAVRQAFADAALPRLWRLASFLARSDEEAAELCQEAFAAFWASLDRTLPRDPLAWLLRILRNRWRKQARDAASRRRLAASESGSIDAARDVRAQEPGDRAALGEERERIRRAVAALPERYRVAVAMRYWGDCDHATIGRALGVPAALARWRVHEGRRRLHRALRGAGFGDDQGDDA